MKKPFNLYILIGLMLFEAISALIGALGLLSHPYGIERDFPVSMLDSTPFGSFILPGLIMLIGFGVLPAIACYGLITRKYIWWMDSLNLYRDRHWSWSGAIYTGIILIIWIDVQIALIGFWHHYQTIYALLGVLILIFALIPSTMRYYLKS